MPMLEKDCKLLRISRDADLEEIRQAFIKLTRRYPPEHFPDKFKQIKGAYDRLTLNWESIKSLIKEIASRESPESMARFLLQGALQTNEGPDSAPLPELDIQGLEPVLSNGGNKEKLRAFLQKIQEQGLEYKSAEQD